MDSLTHLPALGAGLSYRPCWRSPLRVNGRGIDCLEIIAERYIDCPPERTAELEQLRTRVPLVPHGLSLSLGTDAPLDGHHVQATALLAERIEAPWFTEHLAFTKVPGIDIGHLAPLPFTTEAARVVSRNVRTWREAIGVPVLLENIAYLVRPPGDLTEAQFIGEVLDRSGCGLLLDLHNLYANALNHRYDPLDFLGSIPLERVWQVHLSGGLDVDGWRLDTHSAPVPEPVWDLLAHVVRRVDLKAVIVEWDSDLPPFDVVREEVARARSIAQLEGHVAA